MCQQKATEGKKRSRARTDIQYGGFCINCWRIRLGLGARRPRGPQSKGGPAPDSVPHDAQQRRTRCHIEWCLEIARGRGDDNNFYCKKHVAWPCGRSGILAGKCLLENFKDEQHTTFSCSCLPSGEWDGRCATCDALYFKTECSRTSSSADGVRFTLCCSGGKTSNIPRINLPGGILKEMFASDATTRAAKDFREQIRRYNAAMGFVSFSDPGSEAAASPTAGRGPPVYVLHGQVYHAVSTLYPSQGGQPKYGQLYIYDPHEASQRRTAVDPGLDRDVLEKLHKLLLRCRNPYVQWYQHMHEKCQQLIRSGDDSTVVLRFRSGTVPDPRRYNEPTGGDIAAVYTGDVPPTKRDLSVYARSAEGSGETHNISYLNEHVDPLTYPLLFPTGETGWCPDLVQVDTDKIPQKARKPGDAHDGSDRDKSQKLGICDFYAHRFMVTSKEPSLPHAGGRLFQQYIVDAYCKVEGQRLQWINNNQDKLRVESLRGLMDFVAGLDAEPDSARRFAGNAPDELGAAGASTASTNTELRSKGPSAGLRAQTYTGTYNVPLPKMVGKSVFLPPSFSGSPRHLHQCFLDAMTLVASYGKPDFFITMTASPTWKEVTANLRPGEQAHNRPDLVARVFRQKLKQLIHELTVEECLGKVAAYTYVVEFQKRGLPHAHILVILDKDYKLRSAKDVDRFVSAEIPTRPDQKELRCIVETCMLHGPCGALNPACSCMKNGVCPKNFPKMFQSETKWCDNGYPVYRRREFVDGTKVTSTDGKADNRWVVPYNPHLLKRFRCHINVEVCSSIKAIKYLYKYTYKGPDRACLEKIRDEVAEFLDARYVAAPEACWRLFGYPLHARSHVIERLPVHLPHQQAVLFTEREPEKSLERILDKRTKLEGWYDLNTREEKQALEKHRKGDELCAAPGQEMVAFRKHVLSSTEGGGKETAKKTTAQTRGASKKTAENVDGAVIWGKNASTGELVWPAKRLKYTDIPNYYVWDQKATQWKPRQRCAREGVVLSRMFHASPKNVELYALRLLLLHVTGARSSDDLRFVGGELLTFTEAARSRGLLQSEDEFQHYLTTQR